MAHALTQIHRSMAGVPVTPGVDPFKCSRNQIAGWLGDLVQLDKLEQPPQPFDARPQRGSGAGIDGIVVPFGPTHSIHEEVDRMTVFRTKFRVHNQFPDPWPTGLPATARSVSQPCSSLHRKALSFSGASLMGRDVNAR
jgi:hypothetical protein